MTFEEVDRLKEEYTDKYCVVDESRPELARFGDTVGQIKTINYNGRALVEFIDYHLNIGWYDIALDYIKLVPKPDPNVKKEKKEPAAKAAPAAKGEGKPAAAKPAAGKSSTADILAAARAKAGGAAPAAKPAGAKPSTADILAAARAKAAPAAAAPAEATEAAAPAPKAVPAAKAAASKPAAGPLPTTTPEKIAYCRRVDTPS